VGGLPQQIRKAEPYRQRLGLLGKGPPLRVGAGEVAIQSAVLAFFGQGDELVINPAIAKEHQETHYLSGTGLSKFRQNWKKWQAAEKKRREE